MENNVCMGAVDLRAPISRSCISRGGMQARMSRSMWRPIPGRNIPTTRSSPGGARLPLECEAVRPHPRLRVAVSRSHQTPETAEHIARLRATHPDLEIVEQGSSYKFCLLAEGRVDYYVRTTHTYEWDTAAGELILAEAGGRTRTLPDDGVLRYNEKDLRNPWFVCRSKYCVI